MITAYVRNDDPRLAFVEAKRQLPLPGINEVAVECDGPDFLDVCRVQEAPDLIAYFIGALGDDARSIISGFYSFRASAFSPKA